MALKKKKLNSAEKAPLEEEAEQPLEQVANTLRSFEEGLTEDEMAPFSVSALGLAFNTVVEAVKKNVIPNYELVKLLDELPNQKDTQEFDASFDLSQEINGQLNALQSIRNQIFSSDGRIRDGQTVKDAKDFMASSSQLLQMLQKSRAELINTERLQAVEEATIETLRELGEMIDEDLIKRFLEALESKLVTIT